MRADWFRRPTRLWRRRMRTRRPRSIQAYGASSVSCPCLLNELAQPASEAIDFFHLRIAVARCPNGSTHAEVLQKGQRRKIARSYRDPAGIEVSHDLRRGAPGDRKRKHGQPPLRLPWAQQAQAWDLR